jgi:hypothetical protein
MDGQDFLPPTLPHDQIKLPDKLAHWPSFPHLKLPYTNSYPNLKAQRQQHPLPYTMSHDEHNPDTGAKRIGPGPPATPTQGNNLTNADGERHDSLTKVNITHTSPTSSVPSGWIGSRLPSSNIPRKAPLAARSSDEISPLMARKIPKTKQLRSTNQPKAAPEPSQANRIRQQKSFNTQLLGTPKRGRPRLDDGLRDIDAAGTPKRGLPRLDDGLQDIDAAGDLDSPSGHYIGQQSGMQPPIGMYAPPQVSTARPPQTRRPRPRYSYNVPLELLGTQKALGNYTLLKTMRDIR